MFISAQLLFPPQLFSPKLNPGLPWKDNKTYGVVIQISNLVIAVEPWYTIPTIRDTRLPRPPFWTMDTEAWEQSWRRATLLENEAISQGTVVHMPSSQSCGTLLLFISLFRTQVFIVIQGLSTLFQSSWQNNQTLFWESLQASVQSMPKTNLVAKGTEILSSAFDRPLCYLEPFLAVPRTLLIC